MDISVIDAAAAANGRCINAGSDDTISRVSTDTRTMRAGDCFLALTGENFDGMAFVEEAVFKGASSVIVSREIPGLDRVPQIIVDDTLAALGALAKSWRQHTIAKPLAIIAGSAGKTTTKEIAARIVGYGRSMLATTGNLNNLIGVPKMIFEISARHDAVVLEVGMNQPGELRRLAEMTMPDCVALTNIRDAHIGNFGGSQEALYHEKCEILRHAPPQALMIFNADDPFSVRARAECAGNHPVLTFGMTEGADIRATRVAPAEPYGHRFLLHIPGAQPNDVMLRAFGRANIWNALCAAAIGHFFGVAPEIIAGQITLFRCHGSRSEVEEMKGWYIIKDYYNASPSAVEAALRSLAEMPVPGRRYALLADMLELGDQSEPIHRGMGAIAAESGLATLFTMGPSGRIISEAAAARGLAVEHLPNADAAAKRLRGVLKAGDVLLMKGSRLMKLELVYERLRG